MKPRAPAALVSVALLACLPVLFGADDAPMTQMELTADAGQTAAKADAALNVVYRKFLATKSDDAQGRRKLVEAERQWIKYRDAECDSAADDYRGGSIAPMVRCECATALTEARTAELKRRLDDH